MYDHEKWNVRSSKAYDLTQVHVYDLNWKYTIIGGKLAIICWKYTICILKRHFYFAWNWYNAIIIAKIIWWSYVFNVMIVRFWNLRIVYFSRSYIFSRKIVYFQLWSYNLHMTLLTKHMKIISWDIWFRSNSFFLFLSSWFCLITRDCS